MKTKKLLKNLYKEKKFRIGVFQIRNTQTNKIFIGSSTDLIAIWNRYKFQLNNGSHPNIKLQNDWKALGEENFTFEILDEIEQNDEKKVTNYQKEVKELERMFIEELKPFDNKGYNANIL